MEQVVRLCGALFDLLQPLHGMGPRDCELLCCAALVHDIGLSVSPSGHHKHSRDLILRSDLPALSTQERDIIANLARYHRKAQPAQKHGAFRGLTSQAQGLVRRLAAMLRPADGLDRAHENAVGAVEASAAAPTLWVVGLYGPGDLGYAAWGANRKAGMFKEVYGVELRFEPRGPVL